MPKKKEYIASDHVFYVIECRHEDGTLDFTEPQPESYFGMAAIQGINDDAMAQAIFRTKPDAALNGYDIPYWPRQIDPRWTARRRTW